MVLAPHKAATKQEPVILRKPQGQHDQEATWPTREYPLALAEAEALYSTGKLISRIHSLLELWYLFFFRHT
jgi:hypothetical protein